MKMELYRYRCLLENLPDAFAYHQVVTNDEGVPVDYIFLEVNDAFEKMTGLKRKKVIGKTVTEALPGIEKSDFDWIGVYGQVALGGEPARFENYSKQLRRWYDVSVYSDTPGYFVTVFCDINEKRQVEIELENSKDRLEMLAEHSLTIIWEVDSSGLYTYVSPVIETILGYRPEEIIGKKHFYDLYPKDGREAFKNKAFEVFARKDAFLNMGNRAQTKAGDIIWLNTNGIPLLNKNGNLVGYRGSDTDITEYKQVEKKLQQKEVLQQLLMTLATELVHVPLEKIDIAINQMLKEVGEFSGLDRVYIFKHDYSRSVTTNTYEWCAEGIAPEIDNCQAIPLDLLHGLLEVHQRGDAFIVPRVSDLPENNRFRMYLEQQDVCSLLTLPLMHEGTNIGFVGFDAVSGEKTFSETEINLLHVLAEMIVNVIERQKNDKALRESEEKYRQIVDNVSDVVWTTDLNLNLIYISPSIEKMVGEPVNVFLKKSKEERYTPESINKIALMIKEELEKENDIASDKNRSRIVEVEHYRADGSTMWFAMNCSFMRDSTDNIIGLQGTARDITERKQAEEELLRLKVFNESIVQNVNEGVIIYDNSGEAIFANPALLQMSGFGADEFIGTHWTLLVPPQYHQLVDEANVRRSAGEIDRYEMAIKHKNGSLIPVQVSGSPYYDSKNGEMVGTLAVLTNLTERIKAEEDLLALKTFNESIVQNIAEGIVITNNTGEVTFVNPAMVQMLGYEVEEYIGMNWKIMVKHKDYQIAEEADARRREGKADRYDLVLKHKNGLLIPVQISGRPYYDGKTGEIIGTLALFVNLSDRLKAEEALRKSEMRSRALIEAIPDLLFRYSNEGVYLDVVVKDEKMLNEKARQLYRQQVLVGKTVEEVLPTPIAEEIKSAINKTIAYGEIQVLEYSYQLDNVSHYFEARLAPIGTTEVVSIVRDITERKKYEAELQKISFHDQLTGLYNRHFYENELKRLNLSREHPIAVIVADIDNLKLVNDTLGHSEGDKYIKAGAELLKSALRKSDILARVGGDEFAIILPRLTPELGRQLVERVLHQVEEYNRKQTCSLPLSISIGIAVSESSEHSLEETYKRADRNMYADKHQHGKKTSAMIVTLLLNSLQKRSDLSEGEREQVQALCLQIGRALSLDSSRINDLKLLSTAYDLGKVSLPDHIVHSNLRQKKGELTAAEREAIYRHPETGYRIASSSPELIHIADLIMKHHESWDGSGYPLGLKGEEIPIECRIVAIAIAYSAMTNPRPYAKIFNSTEAIEELKRCAGTQFDPGLVKIFTEVIAVEDR